MPLPPRYGPNHDAVEAFIAGLYSVPWLTRLGEPTDQDDRLVRVDFDFLASHHGRRDAQWGNSITDAETKVEQVIFGRRRLDEQNEIHRAITKRPRNASLDAFYDGLVDNYPGYYGDAFSYAHELVDSPDRVL